MSQIVENLKTWFNGLSDSQKRELIDFLYGAGSYSQGIFLGPHQFGINVGPKPISTSKTIQGKCPKCGRAY